MTPHVARAIAVLATLIPPALAASGDDWKAEANARIETIRKRDTVVVVVDAWGRGVAGARLGARQSSHHFAFGTAVTRSLTYDPPYQAFFHEHFEWAVFENDTKWFMNEPWRDYLSFASADSIAEYCEAHGIKMRGHCIFWAKEEYTPAWCRSLPEDELREEVAERLVDAVPRYSGRFRHWDVNNEMLDGDFFRRRLGPEIEPWMFVRAHELDPGAELFVNDYSIIAGSEARTAAYIAQIQSLRQRGAPIHGVGVQGHFWGDVVDPLAILARLDQLSVLGLPVWVTEYDAVDPDENRRADKLENLYRAAFSHPLVEGILMWGFWAGAHWRGADAAIVDLDWRVNAAGQRYEQLLAEWTTTVPLAPRTDGELTFRGFHGTYKVRIEAYPDPPRTEVIELLPGEGRAVWVFPLLGTTCLPAGEVEGLQLAHDPAAGTTTLSWSAPSEPPGMVLYYDLLRSPRPDDFGAAATCLLNDGEAAHAADAAAPPAGTAFFYLARGRNRCPSEEGPLGARSDGEPRAGRGCP
ncbi:MAG: endo-1,4-beta-xylanase [Acidobacteria bacterium]|jgi:GH35 family endo-1,4-beta-xylanase|nr:endo-1,4-beta-xylanase [Acidobacteriota bacterium]